MDLRSWSKTKVTRTTWWELEIIYGELNCFSFVHLQNDFDIWNSALEFFQFLYLECYKPVRCILLLAIWLRTWMIVTLKLLKLFSNFHAPYRHLHRGHQSLSLHNCRSALSGRSCRPSSRRSRRSRQTSSGLKWSICVSLEFKFLLPLPEVVTAALGLTKPGSILQWLSLSSFPRISLSRLRDFKISLRDRVWHKRL